MARKFFIGKTTNRKNQRVFIIFEQDEKGIMFEPFADLAGGEVNVEKICKKMHKIYKEISTGTDQFDVALNILPVVREFLYITTDSGLIQVDELDRVSFLQLVNAYKKIGGYS